MTSDLALVLMDERSRRVAKLFASVTKVTNSSFLIPKTIFAPLLLHFDLWPSDPMSNTRFQHNIINTFSCLFSTLNVVIHNLIWLCGELRNFFYYLRLSIQRFWHCDITVITFLCDSAKQHTHTHEPNEILFWCWSQLTFLCSSLQNLTNKQRQKNTHDYIIDVLSDL